MEFCREYPELCEKYYDVNPTSFGNVGRKSLDSLTTRKKKFTPTTGPQPFKPPKESLLEPQQRGGKPNLVFLDDEDTEYEKYSDFGINRLGEIQRQVARPDQQTRKGIKKISTKIQKSRAKALESISAETEVVEHSTEEFLNAVLSQAAYENAYSGTNKAQKYVKKKAELLPELSDFEIVRDPRFTNNNHTAFRNTKTGERFLAFRGSDAEFFDPEANVESLMKGQGLRVKNAADWGTNLHTMGGQEHKTKRYKDAVKTAREFAAEEGISIHELNTTGHSLGGGQSDHVSEVLGTKSYSFHSARNPFAKRPVHPRSRIKTSGTWFDPVGLARNIHAKLKGGEPDHIEMKNYWAVPGKESGFIDHHELDGQFIDPVRLENGKLVSTRVKGWRNGVNMLGGATRETATKALAGLGGAAEIASLALPFAVKTEYDTEAETKYRLAEDFADNTAITMALSNNLFKVNPMFFLIDEPALMRTMMDVDPMFTPESKRWFQKQLGIKVKEPEVVRYKAPPKFIQGIQTKARKKEEADLLQSQAKADAYGITLNQALAMDIETDMGVPVSEDALHNALSDLHNFTDRTQAYREQVSTEEWRRFYRPSNNPYGGANPHPIGSAEYKEYKKNRIEWIKQAEEEAKIEYRQNQLEIQRQERIRLEDKVREQEYKYEMSPQYQLDMKEREMDRDMETPK